METKNTHKSLKNVVDALTLKKAALSFLAEEGLMDEFERSEIEMIDGGLLRDLTENLNTAIEVLASLERFDASDEWLEDEMQNMRKGLKKITEIMEST